MEYFAGLDVSMEETHICVVCGDGAIIHEAKAASAPDAIAAELAKAPSPEARHIWALRTRLQIANRVRDLLDRATIPMMPAPDDAQ